MDKTTNTENEIAATVRAAIRALGVPARAVGVRVSTYSMGASVIITIKAIPALAHLDAITAIAKASHDASGLIFVRVNASPALAAKRALIDLSAQVAAEMFQEAA